MYIVHVLYIVYCNPLQVWKSLEAGRWLPAEPFEMADSFPAAQVKYRDMCMYMYMYMNFIATCKQSMYMYMSNAEDDGFSFCTIGQDLWTFSALYQSLHEHCTCPFFSFFFSVFPSGAS